MRPFRATFEASFSSAPMSLVFVSGGSFLKFLAADGASSTS